MKISHDALIARINRKLAHEEEIFKTTRGGWNQTRLMMSSTSHRRN